MEKKYLIMLDGQHEYTITDTRNKKGHRVITLFYSEAEFWSFDLRGTQLLKMVDDGNGVKLSKVSKKMDYSQLAELRLLLTFSKATHENPIERESNYEIYTAFENSVSGKTFKI
jgi:hypothetical protein